MVALMRAIKRPNEALPSLQDHDVALSKVVGRSKPINHWKICSNVALSKHSSIANQVCAGVNAVREQTDALSPSPLSQVFRSQPGHNLTGEVSSRAGGSQSHKARFIGKALPVNQDQIIPIV